MLNVINYRCTMAALRMGLPSTGPPSFMFGPPNLLAYPVY